MEGTLKLLFRVINIFLPVLFLFLILNALFFPKALNAQSAKNKKNPCWEFVKTWDYKNFDNCLKFLQQKDANELKDKKKYQEHKKHKGMKNFDAISFLFDEDEKLFYKVCERATKGDEKAIALLIWMEPLIWNSAHGNEELTVAYGDCIISNSKAYLTNLKAIMAEFKNY